MVSRVPMVFVSYSHDSEPHKEWVLQLAKDLRAVGVDAILDRGDLEPGQDLVRFMERGISESDRVILICSDGYVERANARRGGVGFEGLIITGELVVNVDSKKFIPVIRNNSGAPHVPTYLGPRFYLDFRDDDQYETRLEDLVREIHQVPALEKPPLGPNPFSTAAPQATPTVMTRSRLIPGEPGEHVFAESWFEEQRRKARSGLVNAGLSGSMEESFALANPLNKRPNDLLDAAYKAQIHTFGWPLGIVLGNRPEFRPRATQDGILAEIPIEDRSSYDYWALRKTGDYFLLNSLFEDMRKPNCIFMDTRRLLSRFGEVGSAGTSMRNIEKLPLRNDAVFLTLLSTGKRGKISKPPRFTKSGQEPTRIVRTTEAFLYCDGLYRHLGLKEDTTVGAQIAHQGLSVRTSTTAGPNRHVFPETTQEDASETTLVMPLGDLRANLVDNVIAVLEPLFMLFNFKEFKREVYEGLVTDYAAGRVS